MTVEIKDLDGGIGNIVACWGILTGKEYIDALRDHFSQDREKFKKYKYSLCDHTDVKKIEIASNEVEIIAQLCKEAEVVNSDVVVAVAADKDFTYGLSRMWQILVEETGWEIMVFRSRDDAEEWIKERIEEKFGIDVLAVKSI
jgi:hypothetical protein